MPNRDLPQNEQIGGLGLIRWLSFPSSLAVDLGFPEQQTTGDSPSSVLDIQEGLGFLANRGGSYGLHGICQTLLQVACHGALGQDESEVG